jgi:hypothetical protein
MLNLALGPVIFRALARLPPDSYRRRRRGKHASGRFACRRPGLARPPASRSSAANVNGRPPPPDRFARTRRRLISSHTLGVRARNGAKVKRWLQNEDDGRRRTRATSASVRHRFESLCFCRPAAPSTPDRQRQLPNKAGRRRRPCLATTHGRSHHNESALERAGGRLVSRRRPARRPVEPRAHESHDR